MLLDVCKRRDLLCHLFHQAIHIKQGAQQGAELWPKSPMFWIQSSPESSKHGRMRRRRLPDPRPIPEGVCEPIYIRKKCAIWA